MYEFLLNQMITKARIAQRDHNLEDNAYLAYSGGRDSVCASVLLDLALPGNEIPRVFVNTGIEYSAVVKYVKTQALKDPRIVIRNAGVNIPQMLETYGYPFKSKEHSHKVILATNGSTAKSVVDFFTLSGKWRCNVGLRYQYKNPPFLISDKCCYYLKKKPAHQYEKESGRAIVMTGIRKSEGGQRANKACTSFDGTGKLRRFHPVFNAPDDWLERFISEQRIELCELYSEPFNFERTGCKGCPFNRDIESQLERMKTLMPAEEKQCWYLWGKVYREYQRIGFRMKPKKDAET